MRVWLFLSEHSVNLNDFNSHTHEGVTRSPAAWKQPDQKFQLTHPWGCDHIDLIMERAKKGISTHTPVRVWHVNVGDKTLPFRISTHTPVRVWLKGVIQMAYSKINFNSHTREGVTHANHLQNHRNNKFQLTHPWGCDQVNPFIFYDMKISTHTPVRVWLQDFGLHLLVILFQLTHPWGCDAL